MTSTEIAQLERRWKESGSIDDEAAYLLARLQSGDLDEKWAQLAGHAGSLAARKALGGNAPPLPASDSWADLDPWVSAFTEWGRQAAGVTALAAVDASWVKWEPRFSGRAREVIEMWLRVAREWVACPCEAHERAAEAKLPTAPTAFADEEIPRGGGYIIDAVAAVVRLAAGVGPLTVRLPIGNARHGPDGRITDEVRRAIGDKVGYWALYDEH